ncbi:SubName: Full=Uncharacterized protein {ECO:0000313/EMBL:CCA71853.1} [Serendipita indica DSM 11827]|nr:SubName: Full=Uncharacterized protein {ECO:0000313/EMBL:CCA71853.1} [Serendipita indica DSM 11827]
MSTYPVDFSTCLDAALGLVETYLRDADHALSVGRNEIAPALTELLDLREELRFTRLMEGEYAMAPINEIMVSCNFIIESLSPPSTPGTAFQQTCSGTPGDQNVDCQEFCTLVRQLKGRLSTALKHVDGRLYPTPSPSAADYEPPFSYAFALPARSMPLPPNGIVQGYEEKMHKYGLAWAMQMRRELAEAPNLPGRQIIRQLWNRTLLSLQGTVPDPPPLDMDLEAFRDSYNEFDQMLRDSIVRQTVDHHCAVFVGLQNSGKSTLINALIDQDLLPTGDGVVTTLPSRIVHDAEAYQPIMHLPHQFLDRTLTKLRAAWPLLIQRHPNYRRTTSYMKERIELIIDPLLVLPSTVHGLQEVKRTLGILNDIIRISDMFGLEYDDISAGEWIRINIRFPFEVQPIRGHYEFVDIPNYWTILALQTIRRATVVVAVVDANSYHRGSWRDLPHVIYEGTNLPASVIAVTKTDLFVETESWPAVRADIQRTFWKEYPSGLYFEGSPRVGWELRDMREQLKHMNVATHIVWPSGSVSDAGFTSATLDSLKASIDAQAEKQGFDQFLKDFYRSFRGNAVDPYLTDELRGLANRIVPLIESIEQVLSGSYTSAHLPTRHQLEYIGLTPYDSKAQFAAYEALQSEAKNMIEEWFHVQDSLIQECDLIIVRSSSNVQEEGAEVVSGFDYYSEATTLGTDSPSGGVKAFFLSAQDAEHFLENVQAVLKSQLRDLQSRALHSVSVDAKAVLESQLASLIRGRKLRIPIEHLAEQFQEQINNSATSTPWSPQKVDVISLVSPIGEKDRLTAEFVGMQQKVLNVISPRSGGPNGNRPLQSTSTLLRGLVAAIAIWPFALKIPLTRAKSPVYCLVDLRDLRNSLLEALIKPWSIQLRADLKSAVYSSLQTEAAILPRVVDNAAKVKFQESTNYPPAGLSEELIDNYIRSYCNLVAAKAALEQLTEKAA